MSQTENNINRKNKSKEWQGIIFEGGDFPRWRACWSDNFKRYSKSFSIKSYMKKFNISFEEANNLARNDAIAYRLKKIEELLQNEMELKKTIH